MLSFKNKTETRFSKKVDRLFWIFIMLFPILSYFIAVRSNFAFPEKEIDKTIYADVNTLEDYSNVDFSGGVMYFQPLEERPVSFYDKILCYSSGGYSIGIGVAPSVYVNGPNNFYLEIYTVQNNVLHYPEWELPSDFGTLTLNVGEGSQYVTVAQVAEVIKQVSSEPDVISTQTFEYYWENALGFKPITDNVVGNALMELFDKDGFLGFFDNSYMVVTLLVWFVVVELAHLFIDIVLFIPRLAHKWMNCFTQTD